MDKKEVTKLNGDEDKCQRRHAGWWEFYLLFFSRHLNMIK